MEDTHSAVVQWPAQYPNSHTEFVIGKPFHDCTLSLKRVYNRSSLDYNYMHFKQKSADTNVKNDLCF